MQTEKDWMKSAYIYMNTSFINVGTYCGYVLHVVDPSDPEFFFDLGATDEEIGNALFTALNNSRFISLEESTNLRMNEENYKNWIKKTMKSYGFKTKGEMFKPMFYCSVIKKEEGYEFCSTHQRALTSWFADKNAEEFTIPLTATAAEMGAALRRCLALCTSKFDSSKDA
jgi:hypothetical protein